MVKLIENIRIVAEKASAEFGLFLIDINLRGNENNRIIEIFVDGEKSVSAEDLALLSKNVNNEIENTKIIESSYRLDVSTPGVDRPLKFLKQYHKHINRNFNIIYNENNIQKHIKAKLESIDGEDLFFFIGNSLLKINFKDIISAKVQISFS